MICKNCKTKYNAKTEVCPTCGAQGNYTGVLPSWMFIGAVASVVIVASFVFCLFKGFVFSDFLENNVKAKEFFKEKVTQQKDDSDSVIVDKNNHDISELLENASGKEDTTQLAPENKPSGSSGRPGGASTGGNHHTTNSSSSSTTSDSQTTVVGDKTTEKAPWPTKQTEWNPNVTKNVSVNSEADGS